MKEELIGDNKIENAYIIAIEGCLFETDGMFVKEVSDYTAIGEGECFALAAMWCGENTEQAVYCACDLCAAVAPPVTTYYMYKQTTLSDNKSTENTSV